MSTQYYDLRNSHNLPNSGRFVDPNTDEVFHPLPKETLQAFLSRIAARRQEEGCPQLPEDQLRILITMSLAETCEKKELQTLFEPRLVLPDFADVYNFAKVLIQQRFYLNQVGYNKRQERVDSCHGCKLHIKPTMITKFITNLIKQMAGLGDLIESEKEKTLGRCSACSCPMRAKVGFDINGVVAALSPEHLQTIIANLQDKSFTDCWMIREGLADANLHKILDSKIKHSGPRTSNSLTEHKARNVRLAKQGKPHE